MAQKTSPTKIDWTIVYAVAAWVLVLALGGWISGMLDRQAVETAALQDQQATELAVAQSVAAGEEQLWQEAHALAVTRTTAMVEANINVATTALTQKPVTTTATGAAASGPNTSDSTALPSGSASGLTAIVATKTGGNFKASVYNGNTGIGNLASYQAANRDVKAWLRIPGTNINYPVMQSPLDDHYYSHLNWQGAASHAGSLWTQKATLFGSTSTLSPNTVIYGHNWNNCRWNAAPSTYYNGMQMFEALMSYHFTSWAEQYPYIYYSTPSGSMTFVIFATFYTEGGDWYIYANPDVGSMVANAKNRSRSTFSVDVNSSDKILTLSTCTRFYGNTSNQRFVVMARLLRPGEEIGPVTVTYNPNHRQPNVWA